MKRETISELICPWLQVQYPTLGTRQVDLYTKMSRVNMCIWRPKVVCFQPWYGVCSLFAHSSLATYQFYLFSNENDANDSFAYAVLSPQKEL